MTNGKKINIIEEGILLLKKTNETKTKGKNFSKERVKENKSFDTDFIYHIVNSMLRSVGNICNVKGINGSTTICEPTGYAAAPVYVNKR